MGWDRWQEGSPAVPGARPIYFSTVPQSFYRSVPRTGLESSV